MINIFSGCKTRYQAKQALLDAQELGIANPDDALLLDEIFPKEPVITEIDTPNEIKYCVYTGDYTFDGAVSRLKALDGITFENRKYSYKYDIEQEQLGVLSMLRCQFANDGLRVLVLGNWIWIDDSASLPSNIKLRLESHGFKHHSERNRHYWKSGKERAKFARRMTNEQLDEKYKG